MSDVSGVSGSKTSFQYCGFNDKNGNGVIEKKSWRTWFRDEGYRPEVDLNGDEKIDMIEAKYYLQRLSYVDAKTKEQFQLTREEQQTVFWIRLANERKILNTVERFRGVLALANEMEGLGFETSEALKVYEEAANIIEANWILGSYNLNSDNAIKISKVALAMLKHGQPLYLVMIMFKRALMVTLEDAPLYLDEKDKKIIRSMGNAWVNIKKDMEYAGLNEDEIEYIKRDFKTKLSVYAAMQQNMPVPTIPVDTRSEKYKSLCAWLKRLSRLETSEDIKAMVVDIYFVLKEGNLTKEEIKELVKEIFKTIGAIAKATIKIEAVDLLLCKMLISDMDMDEKIKLFELGKETIDQVYESGFRFQGYLNLAVRMHQAGMNRKKIRNMIMEAESIMLGEATYNSKMQIGETMIKCGFGKEETKGYYIDAINSAKAAYGSEDKNGSLKTAFLILNVSMRSSGYTEKERKEIFKETEVEFPE